MGILSLNQNELDRWAFDWNAIPNQQKVADVLHSHLIYS